MDQILTAQQAALCGPDVGERTAAARLILDLLLGHPDLPALSEAIVSHELHVTFIWTTSRVGPREMQQPWEVSLRALHILASQPILHGRLLASGICRSLLNALHSFLSSFPEDGSATVVVAILGHLCLAGGPGLFQPWICSTKELLLPACSFCVKYLALSHMNNLRSELCSLKVLCCRQ